MTEKQIAVFDSGLGGLSAVRELLEILPGEDVIYFGDTARVPYGNRSDELIRKFAAQDLRFLLENADPKVILVACGTISSIALPDLRRMTDIPIFGVVDPTARAAVRATRNRRIGVLGTAATVKSGSYENALISLCPDVQVTAQACPLLVPLVEAGRIGDDPVTVRVAQEYAFPLLDAGVDTVILGCTHYPLLRPLFQRLFGPSVTLIDAGRESALAVERCLREKGELSTRAEGTRKYCVTDEVANFTHIAGMFLNRDIAGQIEKVTVRTDD